MLIIQYTPGAKPAGPAAERRARKVVAQAMQGEGGVFSRSGWTAEMAVRWCVENQRGYTMQAGPPPYYGWYIKAAAPEEYPAFDGGELVPGTQPL